MVDLALGAGAIKAVMTAGPMTIKAVAQEWARRDADARDFATLEPEMDEALNVLVSVGDSSPKETLNKVKALLSGVPPIFSDQRISAWVAAPATRSAVKAAVQALLVGEAAESVSAHAASAAAVEEPLRQAVPGAFDYAVAFVASSLNRKLSVGDRVNLARFDSLDAQLAELAHTVRQPAPPSGLQLELLDQAATAAIERVRKRRFFHGADCATDAADLAARLTRGELAAASDHVRARGLACCARWVALMDMDDTARSYLRNAIDLGAGEEAIVADAFLTSAAGETAALAKLAPIDTDARREAALVIVCRARGAEKALDWASSAGIDAGNLTPDGQHFLLRYLLETGDWPGAYELACGITVEEAEASPALLHGAALARLGNVVPSDQRFLVGSGPPFDGATFNLADSEAALEDRRAAASLFEAAAAAADDLGLSEVAKVMVVYGLWLRLRDPETADEARLRLEGLLEESRHALSAIPLAVAFELPIDRARVARELDRREALEPGGSMEVAVARFTLLNFPNDPEAGLADLRRHKPGLEPYISPDALLSLEFGLLMHLRRSEDAETLLSAPDARADPDLVERLRTALTGSGDGPRLEDLEQWYEADPNSLNLRRLVERLARTPEAPRFFEQARRLVTTTRAVADAEGVVARLLSAGRHAEAAMLLDEIGDLLPASLDLQAAQAWSDYRKGDLAAAWERVTALRTARDERNDRALFANVLITSGHWPELVGYVEKEWENREERSAEQLIELANLAAELGSQRAGEFVQLAAAVAPDDAGIQLASYTLAVRVGVEEDAGVLLHRAIALSDETGPVMPANLQDLINQSGNWRRHTEEVWTKLRQNELPLFVGGQLLRRSGLELQLVPLIANPGERDPRKRSVVPAYSGARGDVTGTATTIGLDGSAVVTLGVLDLLNTVLARPGGVVIAHTTFTWLFVERQKLRFHQPSRIREARALVQAVAAKRLQVFVARAGATPARVDEVGKNLAEMLESAQAPQSDAGQRLVVRPAPVSRVGSFLGETVDLSEMAPVLVSCAGVIDKLAARGHLTEEEEARARAYLAQQAEQRWPDEPEIADDAVLYLDDLSVAYLRAVGVLERLHGAGLTAFVSAQEIEEANGLLELEARGAEIETAIEKIRKPLAEAIRSGAARLAPMVDGDETVAHPNVALMRAASLVDVIVSDDRFMNKNRHIEEGGTQAAIWTSMDLVEQLWRDGGISDAQYLKSRTDLRRGGVVFLTPTHYELATLVARARTRDGTLQETAELRAFRENLQMAQMRGWLHLPTETEWLNRLQSALVASLLDQWTDNVADEDARARSTWLLHCADLRNWATFEANADPSGLACCGLILPLNRLLLALPEAVSAENVPRLEAWLEEEVLEPLKEGDPDAYEWMVGHLRTLVLQGAAVTMAADDD